MASRVKFGIFSGYDPRPWVMKECAANDIKVLERLIKDLSKTKNIQLVFPGAKLPGYDKLCYTMDLCERYAAEFARHKLAGIINVHPTWTFPQLSQKVLASYISKMKSKDAGFSARVLLASIQDTTVPGMVSGMATAGALGQNGIPFSHLYGDFTSRATLSDMREILDLFAMRQRDEKKADRVVGALHKLHVLEFGSLSLQMPTTRINQEELMARWGISSENLDQQVFLDRAFNMFRWEGEPGKSRILKITDSYVARVVAGVYDRHPGKFKIIKDRNVSRDKFALQVAMYRAIQQLAKEKGASAVTVKCQDECSSIYATCCIATSYLGNDTDPLGVKKKPIPISCETDLPTLYSQYLLQEVSGKPSGFGDFRYVKTGRNGKTLLAIVNCGQHPLYYAGLESDTIARKLKHVEYPGQEHFYAAGGAAVRMRTAGGQRLTVARLGVENGRLYLAATVMDTVDVSPTRHKSYNQAWPIIEGYVPVTDKVLGREWPSNHLGFAYGDHIAVLIEVAEKMGIGYKVWDASGNEFHQPA
ncbi:hypothetical protein ACFL54_01025 [Planctomycetota bacterium]